MDQCLPRDEALVLGSYVVNLQPESVRSHGTCQQAYCMQHWHLCGRSMVLFVLSKFAQHLPTSHVDAWQGRVG